ncbi:MAG: hypothetical protein KAG53_04765 [Endozoicomonadaceae bacterium]|nr:hypothetical protein [Endozoicomonadaceae bacterium]
MKRAEETESTGCIESHAFKHRRWYWVVTGLLVLSFGLSGYYLGGSWAWNAIDVMREELVKRQTQLQKQGQQLVLLKQQIAVIERFGQINHDAAEMVRNNIRRLKDKSAELSQELVFYRSIIAPEKEKEAISVQTFELLATDRPDHFQWKLVVIQSAKRHQFLKGELQVTIVGKQGDHSASFALHELSPQLDSTLIRLGFRYFQSIPGNGVRGDIALPEGFTPEYLQVSGQITSPKQQTINHRFNWVIEES